jgi:hypothetical protein
MAKQKDASVDIARRAATARLLIDKYETSHPKAAITEILSDLRHYCDRESLDFAELDEAAQRLYITELSGALTGKER